MNRSSFRSLSFRSAANGARMAGPGRSGTTAIAALALAACAFVPIGSAGAADRGHAVYCLSGDSENDCGFTSLAQCEATAAGGLGECDMAAAALPPRALTALHRFQARPRKVRGQAPSGRDRLAASRDDHMTARPASTSPSDRSAPAHRST
jgi:hypothetical protein